MGGAAAQMYCVNRHQGSRPACEIIEEQISDTLCMSILQIHVRKADPTFKIIVQQILVPSHLYIVQINVRAAAPVLKIFV